MNKPLIILKAYAKINLYLDILGERPDGYHDIFSLMQSVSLADQVHISPLPEGDIDITANVSNIPLDHSNIVYKAVKAVERHTGQRFGLTIHLEKHIPSEAGMAGGSADAAAMIVGLNHLFQLGLGRPVQEAIAAQIGSDVPFCIWGGTAVARGRGEILERVAPLDPFKLLIIKPDFSISTAWAYQQYARLALPSRYSETTLRSLLAPGDRASVAYNIFEELCRDQYPAIQDIKTTCRQLGAAEVMMTGSGSAFYVIHNSDDVLGNIAEFYKEKGYFCEFAHTVGQGIQILA